MRTMRAGVRHSPSESSDRGAPGGSPFSQPPRGRLTTRTIARIVAKYSGQLSGGAIHPHTLRHSLPRICWMKAQTCGLFKKCWGHVSLSTTQKYTHLATDQLLALYDRTHPRGAAGEAEQGNKQKGSR